MSEIGFNQLPCDLVDDFLGDELTAEARRAFEYHLAECPACRDAIASWQELCGTLESATRQFETPPTALLERIERGLSVPAEPVATASRTWRVAALVVAALLAAVVFSETPRSKRPPVASTSAEPAESRTTTLMPPANIQFAGDVIGVPIDIGDPKVTVVWVYPEVKVAHGEN
jgi:anti-sigma factor RsiW